MNLKYFATDLKHHADIINLMDLNGADTFAFCFWIQTYVRSI